MDSDGKIASQWFLRMDDGKTYGPVAFDALLEWAEQARIGPGTQVSPDGTTWLSPEDVPGLDVEWMVLVEEKNPYGPLNRSGVVQLVRDGVVSLHAVARNLKTRQEVIVAEWVLAAEVDERRGMESQLAALREDLDRALDRTRQSEEAANRERSLGEQSRSDRAAQEEALRARVNALEQQVESSAAASGQEQNRWKAREADLVRQVEEAHDRIAAREADIVAAQDSLREREGRQQRSQQEADRLVGEWKARAAALTAERDAALAGVSRERDARAQEFAAARVRWEQREGELVRQADETARRIAALTADAAVAQDAFRERDALCQHLQARVEAVSEESSKKIDALAAERDAALARVSREEHVRVQADSGERARWEAREAELMEQVEEGGRRIAALTSDAAAAQDAFRERDALCQSLRAEIERASGESAEQIRTLTGERDAAVQRVRDLQCEVERTQSAVAGTALQRDEQARAQSDRIRSLEEQVAGLAAEKAREHEDRERQRSEWQTAAEEKARSLADLQRRALESERACHAAQTALKEAVDDLTRERDARDKADAERGKTEGQLRRHVAEAEEKLSRLSVEASDAKRQRETAVHELGVVREELRRAQETVDRLAKSVTVPPALRPHMPYPAHVRPIPRVPAPGRPSQPQAAPARPSVPPTARPQPAPAVAVPPRLPVPPKSGPPPAPGDGSAGETGVKPWFDDSCPECGSRLLTRGKRTFWMRALIVTRRYRCGDCACDFVSIFGRFKHRLG
jgi:chromosome segregation ATPase